MSVLSFPQRGHWGDAKYRGNCSGHVYRYLFERLRPSHFADPCVGSGTSVEVAQEMGIEAFGLDLHSGFNVLRDSILEQVGHPVDLCFSHPPYASMVTYSGRVWGDSAHPDDLSRCGDDDEFVDKLHQMLLNQRSATEASGYYGLLIGDLRRSGSYRSFQADMVARLPANELCSILIKQQHHCQSDGRRYRLQQPRILHEYIVLWQKPGQTTCYLSVLRTMAAQQQRRLTGTWRAVVYQAMVELGGTVELPALYACPANRGTEKLANNANWQAKVRQTLQLHPALFTSSARGRWQLVPAS
jgi:hypothetical protein